MKYLLVASGTFIVAFVLFFFLTPKAVSPINQSFGSSVHSQTLKQATTKSVTSLVATTSVQNSDAGSRIIDKVTCFQTMGTITTVGGCHMALSSDGNAATTDLAATTTLSSGASFNVVTSTFTTVANRVWTAGTYVICYNDGAATTTAGFCAVDYYNP